jgi:hypothetical protein
MEDTILNGKDLPAFSRKIVTLAVRKKAMSAISTVLVSVIGMKTGSFGQLLRIFTALLLFVSADDKNRMANEKYC